MPEYVAKSLGFWNGSRVRPGQKITTAEELDPVPRWMVPADSPEADINASKAAIDLAYANTIDIESIEGTGKDGAVTVNDVKLAIRKRNASPVAEGAENEPGVGQSAASASDVSVI